MKMLQTPCHPAPAPAPAPRFRSLRCRINNAALACGATLLVLAAQLRAGADVNTPAEYVITKEIARPAEKMPPIGANDFGSSGTADFGVNNFIGNGGNEPPVWRNMHRAVNVEGKSFEIDCPGKTSWYQLWNDGFLSGARVRIYRIVDKDGKPLPPNATGKYLDVAKGDRAILVATTHVIRPGEEGMPKGGWVVENPPAGMKPNRVYLAPDAPDLANFDYIVLDKPFPTFDMELVHPRVRGLQGPKDRPAWYWAGTPDDIRFSFAPHAAPGAAAIPAAMGDAGEAAMQVDAVAGENVISQVRFCGTGFGKEALWYQQLEPGKKYRLQAWMRQEGLVNNGEVRFGFGPKVEEGYDTLTSTFHVTGEWKLYTYDMVGPERPVKARHFGPQFTFTGPGKLWMDNIRLFRYDSDAELSNPGPHVVNRTILNELVSTQPGQGPKGSHRVWVLDRDSTMASLMSWYPSSSYSPNARTTVNDTNKGRTLPIVLSFDLATGTSPETRMVPHIVIQHMTHDEQDWLHFVEYMAAPYDPAKDSPATKPWAYKRYQQRGTGTPWTDEFREIIVEFGNETWHNSKMRDWIGFAQYGAIHQGGAEYGLFSQYLINNIHQSPYWASQKLAGKMHFCLGGNYSGEVNGDTIRGYAELAIARCPGAQYIGHANYFGPKWEMNQKPLESFTDEGLFSMIMNYYTELKPRQDKMFDAQQKLAKRGIHYDIIAYEGGPSGYSIDRESRNNTALVEAAENYGKSMGSAVCCIDTWFGSAMQGWTYQDFFSWMQGRYWSSHTMMFDGYRAHIPWLAMKLRNTYASGNLMRVTETSAPTIAGPAGRGGAGAALPLTGAYAMHDPALKRWSVFVVNRKINATIHGTDMGDGYAAVTLQLPFTAAERISLHKLSADPRTTNRESDKVKIESKDLDAKALGSDGKLIINTATGGGEKGLPPGSIYVYVFEETR
ncbi:hypothetical protein DB346_00880 [Verrucomicrobia bacterium LW23]|nr:hypothetical protein DB346_00880 [Verrucomicrobia bacterium LW23]